MYLDDLKKVLFPPSEPYKIGEDEGWSKLENKLGIVLPEDYKNFIKTYGTGGIDNFIWILTPFVQDENVNFVTRMSVMLNAYSESKNKFPQYYKHKVFPEQGGLLPWAYTDNGDEIYWLTGENSNEWSIIVYETRSSEYHQYSMSMVEFLYKIITNRLVCEAFPEDFPSEEPEFISVDVD
ncbi:SMI1/KNR4 family protein [Clostridium estertheticum]|uniref:SMI1/KNR4 family protein n=1 Tax=Clostridium estertheticum TaxID=238834 RepID=UPI001C0E5A71|nr:SMI1/KNR4 family protein [Clostridium estertheticum]MBU3179419.1 SMI1/KNR4 family protein [Clostridium estertheticum]